MRLSFITDEATQSFEEAVAFAGKYGLQGLELRSIENLAVDQLEKETLLEMKRRLDGEGLCACSIAGSFYKCSRLDEKAVREEWEKLKRLCAAADILECPVIRGFSFWQEGGCAPAGQLAPFYEEPARILRQWGKRLLLEADPSVNTTNHGALADLLGLLDGNLFGAIYDPGNDIYDPLGERPYPEGYEAIAPYLGHIHIKDAILQDGKPECVKVGTGLVDYPALFARLRADGYDGWLSLETHYRKNAELSEEQLRRPQGAGFTAGGWEATAESAEALKELLTQAGISV